MAGAKGTVNYTAEQELQLQQLYEEEELSVEQLAEHFNKTERSIRSKLVRMQIYRPAEKTATRATGPTKKELLRDLEQLEYNTAGLDAATKEALSHLLNFVQKVRKESMQ